MAVVKAEIVTDLLKMEILVLDSQLLLSMQAMEVVVAEVQFIQLAVMVLTDISH
jgi:hypothetical protein